MSEIVEEPPVTYPADGLDEFPSFELTAMPNDDEEPGTVTLLPKNTSGQHDRMTHWITIVDEWAIDVEECR